MSTRTKTCVRHRAPLPDWVLVYWGRLGTRPWFFHNRHDGRDVGWSRWRWTARWWAYRNRIKWGEDDSVSRIARRADAGHR